MVLAMWLLGGVAITGVLALVPLGFRLWRQGKVFAAMLGAASTTLADATASLEAAQAARSTGTDS